MSTDKIPDDWTRVKFGDVVRNVNENTRDLNADGIDRVVGLDHLDPGSLRLARWNSLKDLPDGTTFTRRFRAGQVLFGKRRAYQRKVAVSDFEGVCSGDILVFEPADESVLSEFLPYVVQSDGFFDHALGTSAGSLSPRTKWADLAKYEFALPPLDEQLRISESVRAVDKVLQSLSCVSVKDLRSALIASALETATVDRQLGEIISLEYGKGLSATARDGGQYPVVGSAGVIGSHSTPLLSDARTIVVGRKGTAGAVHLIEGPCWPIDTTYFVQLKEDLPLEFVFAQLTELNLGSVVTATAMPGLNREDVYRLRFRIPSPETISELLNALDKTKSLEKHVNKRLESVHLLRHTLLNSQLSGRNV